MTGAQPRPELPRLPERMEKLPVARGYPVPWFVVWLDGDGEEAARGEGKPEFRVAFAGARDVAWKRQLCWVCGQPTGVYRSFVAGPMCAINRTSSEPPCHRDCAEFSAIACPFLVRPHAKRREAGKPEGGVMPGNPILRNPGVALVWTTRKPRIKPDHKGSYLFDLGDPTDVGWFAHGRPATRAEVMESIESGLPALAEAAKAESSAAEKALEAATARILSILPS